MPGVGATGAAGATGATGAAGAAGATGATGGVGAGAGTNGAAVTGAGGAVAGLAAGADGRTWRWLTGAERCSEARAMVTDPAPGAPGAARLPVDGAGSDLGGRPPGQARLVGAGNP
jgi:hypothetical protein